MSLRRSFALFRHDLRLLRRDPLPIVMLTVMPLVVIAFVLPTFRTILRVRGYPAATGAEQAVPGMAVTFAFFVISFIGNSFFREHGWRTWERLRVLPLRPIEIMAGKIMLPLTVSVCQQALLFGAGVLLFGLRVRGTALALVLVFLTFSVSLVCLGLALVSVSRSIQQVAALSNLGAMVFGGLGGAFVPVELLPGWAQAIAFVTPGYWTIRSARSIILDGSGFAEASGALIYLGLLGAVCLLVTHLRFRVDEQKRSWTL